MATKPGLAQLSNQGGVADPWSIIVKSTTETRTSNNVLAADTDLVVPVLASTRYVCRFVVFPQSNSTARLKFGFTCPTAPTRIIAHRRHEQNGGTGYAVGVFDNVQDTVGTSVAFSTTGQGIIFLDVYLNNSTNAGNITFTWAQATSDASNTSVLKGSYVEYKTV